MRLRRRAGSRCRRSRSGHAGGHSCIRSGGPCGGASVAADAAGRECPTGPVALRRLLVDREALLVAVLDELAPARLRGPRSGRPCRVRLADGVAEDAVGVHLVRQVLPARRTTSFAACDEHLVDLLAAEVLGLVGRGTRRTRGRPSVAGKPPLVEEDLDRRRVAVQPARGTPRRAPGSRSASSTDWPLPPFSAVDRRAVVRRHRGDAPVAGGVGHPDSSTPGIQAPVTSVAIVPSPRPLYHSSLQPGVGARAGPPRRAGSRCRPTSASPRRRGRS